MLSSNDIYNLYLDSLPEIEAMRQGFRAVVALRIDGTDVYNPTEPGTASRNDFYIGCDIAHRLMYQHLDCWHPRWQGRVAAIRDSFRAVANTTSEASI